MLTTDGDTSLAMFRKVVASTGPLSGALLAAGADNVCAADCGDRSSRDASTMPTMIDASAISSP